MNRIKLLRQQREMTQDSFAEFCDVSRASIARYDAGGRVDRKNAEKIAYACGVSVDYVLGISQTPIAEPDFLSTAEAPKTAEARIISANIDKMPPKERERALNVLKAACAEYFDSSEGKMA